jgi:MFS family permease
MAAAHDPYAALRSPDYRRLLTGNVLSALGMAMQTVAIGWEVYKRTGSAAALGFTGLVQFVPIALLALPAGHAADRFNRKWLLLLAQALLTTASIGLAAVSYLAAPVPLIFALLLLIGVGRACSAPARWSLLPQLIPPEALPNAVTWNSSGWQVAATVGPTLGGFIIAWTGRVTSVYALTAVCCGVCGLLVSGIRPRPVVRSKEPRTLQSLLAGVRFVFSRRLILAAMTLDLFAVLLGGATALLPIYAENILKTGPSGLGWLRAAPSVGALVMALALTHLPPFKRAGRALLLSVAGFGAATIVFGLSTDPVLSFLMLAVTGALDNVSIVVRATLVQTLTPDEMRGRVSAVNTIFISSSNELGESESGLTAHLFSWLGWNGPVASVVFGGIGTILVVLWVALKWPEVRRLGPLHATKAQPPTLPLGAQSQTEADDEATRPVAG